MLAEREAILAARRLVADAQVLPAICVCHRREDLRDLPLLISEINPNHDMHLRVHSHTGLSTVLYRVPR